MRCCVCSTNKHLMPLCYDSEVELWPIMGIARIVHKLTVFHVVHIMQAISTIFVRTFGVESCRHHKIMVSRAYLWWGREGGEGGCGCSIQSGQFNWLRECRRCRIRREGSLGSANRRARRRWDTREMHVVTFPARSVSAPCAAARYHFSHVRTLK